MDSTDTSLQYLSIYNADTGERETSYVVGIHGETMDELKALAAKNYPEGVAIEQDGAAWNNAVQNDLIYKAGQLVERPAPTEEEVRAQKLAALDSEYSQKISDVETEMAKANAIGDTDYFNDLKAERETLVSEYTTKRGEI
jgi:molybdopterin converting factor small subunit